LEQLILEVIGISSLSYNNLSPKSYQFPFILMFILSRILPLLGGHRSLCGVHPFSRLALRDCRLGPNDPSQMVRYHFRGIEFRFGGGLYRPGGQPGAPPDILYNCRHGLINLM